MGPTEDHREGDLELLARWKAGDRSAGDVLIRRYTEIIKGWIRRKVFDEDTARDLLQDVLAHLSAKRTEIGDNFRGYAYRAVELKVLERARASRKAPDALAHPSEVAAAGPQGSSLFRRVNDHQAFRIAFDRLSDDDRTLLRLKHFQGRTQQEIADQLGEPLGTVAARLRRARSRLKAEFERQHDETPSNENLEAWLDSMYRERPEDAPKA